MAHKRQTVYDQLVAATSELLGPASARFIDRQIDSHLHKSPNEITRKDVTALSEWIRLSIGLLTNDTETIRHYTQALDELGEGS